MIALEEIFNDDNEKNSLKLEYGKSLLDDIKIWSDRFYKHLEDIESSKNTLEQYRFNLNTLYEYCSIYKSDKKGICDIDDTCCNDYLLWMENYKTNKEYGSVKERIIKLVKFIKFLQENNEPDYLMGRQNYFNTLTDDFDTINFILDEFESYYNAHEVDFKKIDNNYIKNYIATLPKASVTTMTNRRAVLHKFLRYIEEETQTNCFEKTLKKMKVYKKPKGAIHKSKTIEKEVIDKLMKFIDDYIKDPGIYKKRVTDDSVYVAYRNTAVILLMMGAGCRISEVLSLRYCDIIEQKKSYRVNIIAGKGNKSRTTYIDKSLFKKHFEYLKNKVKNNEDLLISSLSGKKLDRKNMYNEVKKMFKYIEVDKSGLHIFRHHFGSEFAEKDGSNIKILQDLLGHSVITTTMIYSNVREGAKEDAVVSK